MILSDVFLYVICLFYELANVQHKTGAGNKRPVCLTFPHEVFVGNTNMDFLAEVKKAAV